MKQEPDYYAILQVGPNAEREVIQAAYRRLAAKYHPDVDPTPGAAERMKLLNAAYEVLSDPEKRKAYDLRCAGRQRQRSPAPWVEIRQRPWRLLLLALVILVVAFRVNPRFMLLLAPLLLVLWLLWSRQPTDSR